MWKVDWSEEAEEQRMRARSEREQEAPLAHSLLMAVCAFFCGYRSW